MPTIYPYKDLVEIGRGGMATVYRATAPNGNLVALKVLAFHLATDPTARMRFEQESNLRLTHPNIVRVLDWGVEGDVPFIAMDYIVGESLDRRLTRAGTLSSQELLPILKDTAEALDYAHSRGVIHRDVKPSNILIRANQQALLGDFGVAKSTGITAYTATAARVGSVFYMSPEQANGALELTFSSDIYSLGVTAYYALAGRHPFEADNEIAIARMHMDTKPKHVSDVNPAVPRAVGNVVMQALEKEPSKRPKSAGEFAKAFEAAISQSARTNALAPWLRLGGVAALLVAAIVVALLSVVRLSPAQPASPTNTPVPTAILTASPVNQVVAGTNTGEPAPSASKSPSATATATVTPTGTPTMAASPTASSTPKPTKTSTRTPRPATKTPRPSPVATKIPRPTPLRTPTQVSPTPTNTGATPTVPPTATPQPTSTTTTPISTTTTPISTTTAPISTTTTPTASLTAKVSNPTPTPTLAYKVPIPTVTRTPTPTRTPIPTALHKTAAGSARRIERVVVIQKQPHMFL
jgi:serine/threonine protein kinase